MPDDLHHPSHLEEVSDDSFQRDVVDHSHTRPVLVDFWAPWCAPCKALKPVLEELAGQMKTQVTFVTVNADENPVAPQRCQVRAMPTLVMWRNGEIVASRSGSVPYSILRQWVEYHLMAT